MLFRDTESLGAKSKVTDSSDVVVLPLRFYIVVAELKEVKSGSRVDGAAGAERRAGFNQCDLSWAPSQTNRSGPLARLRFNHVFPAPS
uniref:Uncharacterized protein n=1 Tax=Peronospora matthiolae TaxID=2874970 RepID=A0AAV1UQP9_9STRA